MDLVLPIANIVWHGDLRSQAEVGSQSRSGESSRMLSRFCGSNWETTHGGAWSMHWTVPISLAFLRTAVIWKILEGTIGWSNKELPGGLRFTKKFGCHAAMRDQSSKSSKPGHCGISILSWNQHIFQRQELLQRPANWPIGRLGSNCWILLSDISDAWLRISWSADLDMTRQSLRIMQQLQGCWVFVEPQAVRRPLSEYANIIQD